MIQTETYDVMSLVALTGDRGGGLLMRVFVDDERSDYLEMNDALCFVDGMPVTHHWLLGWVQGSLTAWVQGSRGVRVEVDRDPEQYLKVVAARFTAGGGE